MSKSEEIVNALSKILKIFAYLSCAISIVIFLLQIVSGPYTPLALFSTLFSSFIIFLTGLIFFYLSYGLSQKEKWAWVMGLIIFGFSLIFGITILWQLDFQIYNIQRATFAIGTLNSALFLFLLILSSNVFLRKSERLSLWFQKRGFSLVFFGFIFILFSSTAPLIYSTWVTKQKARQKEIQRQEYQKKVEELKQIKIGSTQIPTLKEFIEQNTANWKVYQSETMGFSIKYPSSWNKLEGISGHSVSGECEEISMDSLEGSYEKGRLIRLGKDPEVITAIGKITYYPYSFSKEILSFDEVMKTKEKFLRNSQFRRDFKKEEVILDGISGIRMSCIYQLGTDAWIESRVFLPGKDNSIYEITTSFNAQKQDTYLPVFNLMLSTLKFSSSQKDVIAPEIISKVRLAETSDTSVTITWETNELSTSQVLYGKYKPKHRIEDISYEFHASEDTTLTRRHSVTISGLKK